MTGAAPIFLFAGIILLIAIAIGVVSRQRPGKRTHNPLP